MKIVALLLKILVFIMGSASFAQAVPITHVLTGSVAGTAPRLADIFPVGTEFRGSYTFDSAALDQDPSLYTGIYGPLLDLSFSLGSYVASGPVRFSFIRIDIQPSVGSAQFFWISFSPFRSAQPLSGLEPVGFSYTLIDRDGTAFPNDRLPTVFPSLMEFELSYFQVTFSQGGVFDTVSVFGDADSQRTVPQSSTLFLLVTGLLMLWSYKWLTPPPKL